MVKNRLLLGIALVVGLMLSDAKTALAGNERRAGTVGATELLIPVGAQGIALSNAVIANASGLEALYWNPAGLATGKTVGEAMFSNMSYIADININYAALSFRAGNFGNIGASVKVMDFGKILRTTNDDPDGNLGSTYSPTYLVAGITFARAFTDKIFFGLTTKVISERILRMNATGIAFDVGLQYQTPLGLRLGIVLKNLGSGMRFDGPDFEQELLADDKSQTAASSYLKPTAAEFELPATLELGLSYAFKFQNDYEATFVGNFQNNNFFNDQYNLGAEFGFRNIIFGRIGYTILDGAAETYEFSGISLGAGLSYNVGRIALGIDYAYRAARTFKGNQVFTIKLGF